ncbi:MAG TPA: DNA/RNA non-specific endonuclease [Pyrinomonadaceae bacterium]|nr:DNA/RNA non-specific endonuclease [Pyrinomonadaceae bacterium]
MDKLTERVLAAVAAIEQRDAKLAEELNTVREQERITVTELAPFDRGLEALVEAEDIPTIGLETIVLRTGRPVLAVSNNEPQLVFNEVESEVWKGRLVKARDGIIHAVRAVGRIELKNNPRFEWVGTGWLVDEDIVVTNRHVASEFARGSGGQFTFLDGPSGTMSASIDFLREIDSNATNSFDIRNVLYIEPDKGPDIAFLRVKPRPSKQLATPIALAKNPAPAEEQVAVIGYPARDSRVPETDLMDRIFGNVYNKKRLAPGQLIAIGQNEIQHDCSTLGGNSGSVVLGLKSGEAVGLHFSGQFLKANFAVSASLVANRLSQAKGQGTKPTTTAVIPASPKKPVAVEGSKLQLSQQQSGEVTFEVPLTITVRLGPSSSASAPQVDVVAPLPPRPEPDEDEDDVFDEGKVEDYSGREGYLTNFLGDAEVPLPKIIDTTDLLTFEDNGRTEHVLRYQHFSVVMNAKRRMCYYSAVNINGKESHGMKRGPWKIDPRIAKQAQIMKECYGNAPKFSRGHMTRREDPIWGNEFDSKMGNADSMHVTNTTPQMQPFNAGIWLGLEDYALQNSREDDMSISVFTGPFFSKNDPIRYGVKIPISFWKVIAFVHDETGELCATGYTMSQRSYLQEEEFIFGQHETAQRSISSIEQQAGLDFGPLSAVDPLQTANESFATELTNFSQILFV